MLTPVPVGGTILLVPDGILDPVILRRKLVGWEEELLYASSFEHSMWLLDHIEAVKLYLIKLDTPPTNHQRQ